MRVRTEETTLAQLLLQRRDQLARSVLILEWVTQWLIGHDDVVVSAANPLDLEIPALLQVVDDPLYGADSYADGVGHVALTGVGLSADRNEDVSVVGEEGPRRKIRLGCANHARHNTASESPLLKSI